MTAQETEHKTRAVIVEDEELARQLLRELLKHHPEVEVVGECANGFEAVKMVPELKPDLLFLDIHMPKLDGFEVLELVGNEVAVIFVTAYANEKADQIVGEGAYICLEKTGYKMLDQLKQNAKRALKLVS